MKRFVPAALQSERLLTVLIFSGFLTPFVSVGTVKLGMRFVPADWLLFALGLTVLSRPALFRRAVSDHPRRIVVILGFAFGLVAAVSLLLGVTLYSDANLAKLPSAPALVRDIGQPVERGLVDQLRLVQGLAALLAILGLVRTPVAWRRVAEAVTAAGVLDSLYGGYQVLSQAALGTVHQPPGAFPYPELLRASGTFPEPIAYAGFLLFAIAVAVVLVQIRPVRWLYAALVVMVVGVSLSRSTVALLGLLVLIPGLVYIGDRRSLGLVVASLVAGVLLVALAGGGDRVAEVVRKPFTEQNSVQDRRASWVAAARMGATYSPLGVGRGQYAYNVAPFVGPADTDRAGRTQSAALESWAETGPVGMALLVALFLVGPLSVAHRRLMRRLARALLLLAAVFGVVVLVYYTSTYVWLWFAVGLLVTGPLVFDDAESSGRRSSLHARELARDGRMAAC